MKLLCSLAFCICVMALFVTVTAASRRGLPTGLLGLYGDISGISALTIEGDVLSWEGRYGYSFTIAPGGQQTRMRVFNNSRAFDEFAWRPFGDWHWRLLISHLWLTYLPVCDTQPVAAYSANASFVDLAGRQTPVPEYRIYSEVFAVVPMIDWFFPLYPPTHEHRLFMYAGPGAYIASYNPHLYYTDWRLVHDGHISHASGLQFFSRLNYRGKQIVVPTGPGLFGSTAVYAVYVPELIVLTEYSQFPMLEKNVLFPITLERGEDEIIGMLELSNSILLFISRAGGLEVTRIHPTTGETRTVFLQTDATFTQHFLCENFLILRGFGDNHESIIAAFDLQNNGINIAGAFPITREFDATVFTNVQDAVLSDGIIYVAYTISRSPWEHSDPRTESFISAFDGSGRLIGRAQALTGVEEDAFWTWAGHGRTQRYNRTMQSLKIRMQ